MSLLKLKSQGFGLSPIPDSNPVTIRFVAFLQIAINDAGRKWNHKRKITRASKRTCSELIGPGIGCCGLLTWLQCAKAINALWLSLASTKNMLSFTSFGLYSSILKISIFVKFLSKWIGPTGSKDRNWGTERDRAFLSTPSNRFD